MSLIAATFCRNYGPEDVTGGKAAAKAEVRRRFGLSDADIPLAAVVTRLTHQKVPHNSPSLRQCRVLQQGAK